MIVEDSRECEQEIFSHAYKGGWSLWSKASEWNC